MGDMAATRFVYKHAHPSIAADCVVFGFDNKKLQVLLVERAKEPEIGKWALPGGFLKCDETVEDCALRELEEETNISKSNISLKSLGVFSEPKRDIRKEEEWENETRVVSVAFYALVKSTEVKGGTDASSARWFSLDEVEALAFDHNSILKFALKRIKEDICFEPIGFDLLPSTFKMSELQTLYEAILQEKFDRRNFYNKMQRLGLLAEVGERPVGTPSRIPIKYRFIKEKYDELKEKGFKLEF